MEYFENSFTSDTSPNLFESPPLGAAYQAGTRATRVPIIVHSAVRMFNQGISLIQNNG